MQKAIPGYLLPSKINPTFKHLNKDFLCSLAKWGEVTLCLVLVSGMDRERRSTTGKCAGVDHKGSISNLLKLTNNDIRANLGTVILPQALQETPVEASCSELTPLFGLGKSFPAKFKPLETRAV